MTPLPAHAVTVAQRAVLDAVLVCREAARRLAELGHAAKDDASPVTVADFAAQAIIVHHLRELGPGPILGEEDATMLREPEHARLLEAVVAAVRPVWPEADAQAVLAAIDGAAGPASADGFWTVDPIDGTRGFLRGGQYAVCLAFIAEHSPRIAVLGCPNLPREASATFDVTDPEGTLLVAEAGRPLRYGPAVPGAQLREADPLPSEVPSPIVVTCSVDGTYSRLGEIDRVLERLGEPVVRRPAQSQAKYGIVARGQAHAYLRFPLERHRAEHVWDHAPGWLVATTAGMRVTDLRGLDYDFSAGDSLPHNYGVVCAAPAVHGRLLDAIAALGLHDRDA